MKKPWHIILMGFFLIISGLSTMLCVPGFLIGILGNTLKLVGDNNTPSNYTPWDIASVSFILFIAAPTNFIAGIGILKTKWWSAKMIIWLARILILWGILDILVGHRKWDYSSVGLTSIGFLINLSLLFYFTRKRVKLYFSKTERGATLVRH